jgi:carbon storage regulator
MLISRKKHEAIVLSTPQGEVIVEVVEVRGDKVRLGIKCDKDIPVHRKESFDAIQQEIDDKDNDNECMTERLHVVGGTVHLIDEVSTHPPPPSHLELLMGAINNLIDQRCIDDVVVDGEGAVITTDDGVTKQNWDIKPTKLDGNF